MGDIFRLEDFDKYREDNRREVKKAKGGLPRSLWDTYSSFCNCYGGVIILGVAENEDKTWKTTGLKASDESRLRKEFWDTINNKTKVSVNLLTENSLETYTVGEDLVLVIHVPRAPREIKPVYINNDIIGGSFRRNWEGDYHCTPAEVRAMLRDAPEETMDMKVLENMDLSVLNMQTVKSYRNRHAATHADHVWENLPDEEYLERIGAAKLSEKDGKMHPTGAGLLMFGEEYKILYEYPEYFLDYREMLDPSIRWTDRFQSSSGDWTGNLFDFFFRAYPKMVKDVKVPFKLDGIVRVDDTPVHRAIREALANCLVNTDFFVPRGVVIRKDQDQIIIENPGYIRTGKEQMIKGGVSDPRNKALMKMFNMIGIGERAGSGVPGIYAVWEAQGWIAPAIEEQYGPDRTILTLSFVKKQAKKASEENERRKQAKKTSEENKRRKTLENEAKIRELLLNNKEMKTSELAEAIGLSEQRTRVILQGMKDVKAVGNTTSRRYRLE